ncbi:aspartate/glutamate racemase family protein [Lichenibacterium ramalinae]|uniref:Aspartate/glutamate racemase family protein n=1 Tax=Lichenibacterium ramalinae TaxID=2316527 RepID=A0A4Q2RKJ3_9HYPH|nr:aspartate/glutamate racemase family protein [Lichenibacterium ramalinae]RYB07867.1 aspartate/glutamate racemase family protein [Lichenibacterium ramalinae]
MRGLGLLGGMSWESTALYYRLLNEGVRERRGGLHSAPLLLWSFDFAGIAARQAAGAWDELGEELGEAGRRLAAAGAEALLLCTNTMHRVHGAIEARAGVPVLHIADAAGRALREAGCRRPAFLGTRFSMEQDFYTGRLAERHGIHALVPGAQDRATVHDVIYGELCRGIVRPESKRAYLDVVGRMAGEGADGVILGCTEITMLIGQADMALPVFDTTALHAAAGVAFMLGEPGAA